MQAAAGGVVGVHVKKICHSLGAVDPAVVRVELAPADELERAALGDLAREARRQARRRLRHQLGGREVELAVGGDEAPRQKVAHGMRRAQPPVRMTAQLGDAADAGQAQHQVVEPLVREADAPADPRQRARVEPRLHEPLERARAEQRRARCARQLDQDLELILLRARRRHHRVGVLHVGDRRRAHERLERERNVGALQRVQPG